MLIKRTDLLNESSLKNDKELWVVEKAIEGEFKRLDELFLKIVEGRNVKIPVRNEKEEKEEKVERAREPEAGRNEDELSEVLKSAFSWEEAIKTQIEEELIREQAQKLGYFKDKTAKEIDIYIKNSRKIMNAREPQVLEESFQKALDHISTNKFAKSNKHLQQLGEVYLKIAVPLEKKAKAVLEKLNSVAAAAADKGKVAAASFKAVVTEQELMSYGLSAQQVHLLENVVWKKSSPRAQNEERLFEQVSKFFMESGTLSIFHMSTTNPLSIRAPLMNEEERSRAIFYEEDSKLTDELRKRLTPENTKVLEEFLASQVVKKEEASITILSEEQKIAYEKCSQQKWVYTTRAQDTKDDSFNNIRTIGFEELRKICLTEGIEVLKDMTLLPSKDLGPDSIPTTKDIYLALEANFNWKERSKETIRNIYFVPILEGERKGFYEKCEKFKWLHSGPEGVEVVSFKTLQRMRLMEGNLNILNRVRVVPQDEMSEDDLFDAVDHFLTEALIVSWKAVVPAIVVSPFDQQGKKVETSKILQGFDAKIRVKDMLQMYPLMKDNPRMLEGILQRLSPQAEQQMMLTLTLQTLDLHTNNVGFRPALTPEYEAFMGDPNFKDYQENYLSGRLTETTPIVNLDGTTKTLREQPELLKALQGPWEIVLFDTDVSLEESNLFSSVHYFENGQFVHTHHMIPFRSAFLEIPVIRDKAFTAESLELVRKESLNEEKLKSWIRGEDRPIQRSLKNDHPSLNKRVQEYIQPLIDKFSFKEFREKLEDVDVVLSRLSHNFALELGDIKIETNKSFWEDFEREMSVMKPLSGENLKDFALRKHIELEYLIKLNPSLKNYVEKVLPDNSKIKIQDLTSSAPEARKNRIKVATQLFPRMTTRQSRALFDRKEAQTNYLKAYREIKDFFDNPGDDISKIRNKLQLYIGNPHTPFPSVKREEYYYGK